MFKPLSLYVGLRYTRSKKKNHFISFISLSSMLGIALGVMVLITVLSVMNGFDEEIHHRFFSMAPEVTINSFQGRIDHWHALEEKLSSIKAVKATAPFVNAQGLLTFEGQVVPILLNGISVAEEDKVSHLKDKLILGDLKQLPHFGIVLGRGVAERLGVMIGDKVTAMIPEANVTITGMIPRFKRFTVVGIFSAGTGFNFDTRLAFIDLDNAQTLMRLGEDVSGIKLKLYDIYAAPHLASVLQSTLGDTYEVSDWTQQFGEFFHAVKMEKTMMFLILLLIIAVAAFNLVSSLVMVVNDKQADIAILRTMGATPRLILNIFMVQGLLIGWIGTVLGLISGVLLASHATEIVNHLQQWLGVQWLSSNIYFVDYLPSKILGSDLLLVCATALLMSFLATIYPAWRASRTEIAEALHYE